MDQLVEAPSRAAAHAGVGSSWSRWVGTRFTRRRVGSRQFCFAVAAAAMAVAKLAHLHAQRHSIPPLDFVLWGPTFFLQDLAILLFARALTDHWSGNFFRMVTAVIAITLSILLLFMASVTVSFYITAGAEIHWRQLKTFLKDSSAAKTLRSGATGCFLTSLLILVVAWIITPYAHTLVGKVFQYLPSFIRRRFRSTPRHRDYTQVGQDEDGMYSDGEEPKWEEEDDEDRPGPDVVGEKPTKRRWMFWTPVVLLLLLRLVRPPHQAFTFLSQTLALSPWSNLGHASGVDMASLIGAPSFGDQCDSVGTPPQFDWLPEKSIPGFEDWYQTENGTWPTHYSPERDCSHINNLNNDFLDPIKEALRDHDVNVKHIILVKLETTRKDVFPLVKDSYLWNRIAETHPDRRLPHEIEDALHNLTNTIEYITGDSTEGDGKRVADQFRGGISASDAFTASTYTLKSVIGTLCGIMPLSTDFNQEHYSHFYNPCISHVLEMFNQQLGSDKPTDDFKSWPWRSMWMQSVTDTFDNQGLLTPVLGFNESITKESLNDPKSKFFPPKSNDINYFGLADTELKPYLKDALENAEKKQERLFVTHLTGTTHHPWGLPPAFDVKEYLGHSALGHQDNFNNYLNTVKFIDGWLGDILSVLNETGVSNETLIVMAGDHGASLPEDGGITPFDNPHVGVFHVPMVFSHPALPPVKVDAPMTTLDVLPTILDLLVESSSLEKKSKKAASDLLPLYEGQSLLRPVENFTDDGHKLWHFTVMNSGGSWLSLRSTTSRYRVAVPLVQEVAWRFTDLETDPHEASPLLSFGWTEFTHEVQLAHGQKAVDWLNEAARAADWWLSKNRRLWHWKEG